MPITPQWENLTKQVVVTEFGDTYTWNDFYKPVREVHNMVASVDHQVDIIFCYTSGLPPGNPLIHFKKAFEGQPVNTGQVVIVNRSNHAIVKAFMKSLSSVLLKIFPAKRQVIFSESLEEARKILAAKVR